MFLKYSIENNISTSSIIDDPINDLNEILSNLSDYDREKLREAFPNTLTLYKCKTILIQLLSGGTGNECLKIEFTSEGQIRVQKYMKISNIEQLLR